MSNDLPNLSGIVFMNSCDSMRRLADAWKAVRPQDLTIVVDLPSATERTGGLAQWFLEKSFKRLWKTLCSWNGNKHKMEGIFESIASYNKLSENLNQLKRQVIFNTLMGGRIFLQEIYNKACTLSIEQALLVSQKAIEARTAKKQNHGQPVFLFGNLLHDVEFFKLFELCGLRICDDDLCTGSRMIRCNQNNTKNPISLLAKSVYNQPPCARTFDPMNPGSLVDFILQKVKDCSAT